MDRISITSRRAVLAGVQAIALVAGLGACGSSGAASASSSTNDTGAASTVAPTAPTPSPTPVGAKLTIKADAATPSKLTVKPGEKIQITNSDKVAHELADTKDKLNSGSIKASGSGSLTAPKKAGTYQLVDPKHSGTKLTLVVS